MSDTILTSTIVRGTPLYKVFNGKLETVRFVQKQILEGASKPTYTVGGNNRRRVLVSTDYYHTTLQEAWAEEAANLTMGIQHAEQQIFDLQKSVVDSKEQLARAKLESGA